MSVKNAAHKNIADHDNHGAMNACPSCGSKFNGVFCSACGEKKLSQHDFSIRHFAEETFEGFTHFDNKFFRTLGLLIRKPGQLSVDFCEGRRVPYMKPFPMFIICNVLFFMMVGSVNIFSQPLTSFFRYTPYTYFGSQQTILSVVKSDSEFSNLALAFDQRMGVEAKAFLAIFIPILALGTWGIYFKRRKYFAEHLIFSTHYFTFLVLVYTVWALLVTRPYVTFIDPEETNRMFDRINSFVCIVFLSAYFAISSRRFFKLNWTRAVFGSLFIAVIFMVSLMAYRTLLFYKIIYSLN